MTTVEKLVQLTRQIPLLPGMDPEDMALTTQLIGTVQVIARGDSPIELIQSALVAAASLPLSMFLEECPEGFVAVTSAIRLFGELLENSTNE